MLDGFELARASDGSVLPDCWQRRVDPQIVQRLYVGAPGRWKPSICTLAPEILGLQPPWRAFRGNVRPAKLVRGFDSAAWFARQEDATGLADSLLSGISVSDHRAFSSELLAVVVLVGAGLRRRGAEVLSGLQFLDLDTLEVAQGIAAASGLPLARQVIAPPSAAALISVLTRVIAGGVSATEVSSVRARRWLESVGSWPDDSRVGVVRDLAGLVPPIDSEVSWAWWRHDLEDVRHRLWSDFEVDVLPDLGRAGWPVKVVDSPSIEARDFETHSRCCPFGRPSESTPRLDLDVDAEAFPVWSCGDGMLSPSSLGLRRELTADLLAWASAVQKLMDANLFRGLQPAPDVVRRLALRSSELARRLETETGHAVVSSMSAPSGDASCPTEGCRGTLSLRSP